METRTEQRPHEEIVEIHAHPVVLEGDLALPPRAKGIVLFAHGSGSSRRSPRNRYVAERLRERGDVGTLLVDLLSVDEEREDTRTRALRFDIDLLSRRLLHAITWLERDPRTRGRSIGLFGASTGAAAALAAAASRPDVVCAVVSRGGRPDLAGEALTAVQAPTLLVVGSLDQVVLGLNEDAQRALAGPSRLAIVEGATHLFEEPGALEEVARLASSWFEKHLQPIRSART